jgi:hypothetical protein
MAREITGGNMKKLFRFKYEGCNGTCYAWDSIFYEGLRKLKSDERQQLVAIVTQAHDKLCDNPNYYFGLDMCEKTGLFIGHFIRPTRTDLFTDSSLAGCITELTKAVIETDIPVLEGSCTYGRNGTENLAQQILAGVANVQRNNGSDTCGVIQQII